MSFENVKVAIGTVTTGAPGSNASVTNSGPDADHPVLNFVLPQGASTPGIANYLASGRKFSLDTTALNLDITSGVDYISSTTVNMAANVITLAARMASLIVDQLGGTTVAIPAALPAIDNNTVGRWIFNQAVGAVVPNSAVGISSIAVANNLTPSGTLLRADGMIDYATQGDGTSGGYAGANSTGFPIGASVRSLRALWTCRSITETAMIVPYGTGSGTQFTIENNAGVLTFYDGSTGYSTGYVFTVNPTPYLIELGYDGTNIIVLVNGKQIYKLAYTCNTVAGIMYILRNVAGNYSNGIIHFVELRNIAPTEITAGPISNKLLLPCRYTGYAGVYPTIATSDLSTAYHEWRFSDTSGTAVTDSAGTLNGVATGTTIVPSEIFSGLKARSFNGTSDKIACGAIAFPTAFTIMGVINVKTNAGYCPIIGNYSTAGMIFSTSNAGNGLLNAFSTASGYVTSTSPFPTGVPAFFAIVVSGGNVTFYVNSPIADVTKAFTVDSTSLALWIANYSTYFTNLIADYLDYFPRGLSQAEIAGYYSSLMAKSDRTIIDDVVPANALAVGFVQTGSIAINSFVDSSNPQGPMPDYAYGIRCGLQSYLNKKKFLGWKYFSGSTVLTWNDPFGTRKIEPTYKWAQDANGTNESIIQPYQGGNVGYNNEATISNPLSISVYGSGVTWLNGVAQSSGYIGCYAEIALEIPGE